jgi:phosphoadenosine phosphosulfate reductase
MARTLDGVQATTHPSSMTPDELRAFAAEHAERLENATADEVVQWAHDTFGDRLVVTSSMGDALIPHLCSEVVPGIEVLFLDTGYHFAETLGTRDAVAGTCGAKVRTILPLLSVAEQDALYGPRLYERDPDACCQMRKVQPLDDAMADYDAWISGVRRDETPERADTPVVGYDEKRNLIKVSPIATWTQDEADAYMRDNGVLVNPLVSEGYLSIGCAPCTRAVQPGEDPRAGRWAGSGKSECGLHG